MASVTCPLDLHMVDLESRPAPTLPDWDILTLKCPSQATVTEISNSPNISRSPSVTSWDSQRTEKCISPADSALSSQPPSPAMEVHMKKPRQTSTTSMPTTTVRPPHQTSRTSSSRPSSAVTSPHPHSRSHSHSTARSRPHSRHNSLHSSRRAGNASIVTVSSTRSGPLDKRESLLALHRESCRLFQDQDAKQPSTFSIDERRPSLFSAPSSIFEHPRGNRTSADNDFSAPSSPVSSSHSTSRQYNFDQHGSINSTTDPHYLSYRDRSSTLPSNDSPAMHTSHVHSLSTSSIHVPATVMEWTSATTRRAEYEKIDRASRGVRGLWRRVAPRWCQSRASRTPFFEEGKPKSDDDGSVRRFRMDLPEEEEPPCRSKPFTLKSLGLL
ncbi:Uncharacterized protein PECH_000870 [Penicillium ucsense]|uniref:Uncharacterized protein n=1 Tax=Penicillium ucsense TaxID=2839758 RepID=A0A8J8WM72_9EURO|nr:Uncharacterized protein PECM_006368 [Penicillium ucsense]KAF7733311.1 Uncharacterized protein PECH_000870 [Penicillium ucsense]